MNIRIPLFRVDEKEKNLMLAAGHVVPASTEEGDWAGAGLYFWDNLGNASFWLSTKRANKHRYSIVKCWLLAPENQVLDLTEPNSVRQFLNLIALFRRSHPRVFLGVDGSHKGALINTLRRWIPRWNAGNPSNFIPLFTVVKVIGYYPRAPEPFLFRQGDAQKALPHATIKAKPIYSIIDQKQLTDSTTILGDEP